MTTVLIVGGLVGIVIAVIFAFANAERARGASEAVLQELKREAEISKKQAEIIAENRTPEDAAKRLDTAGF